MGPVGGAQRGNRNLGQANAADLSRGHRLGQGPHRVLDRDGGVEPRKLKQRIIQAIGREGKLPLTVVILDEVQQYINDDAGRSLAVQDVKEQCNARLGANFLLIGTGQNGTCSFADKARSITPAMTSPIVP